MNKTYHQQVHTIFKEVFAQQSANIIKACELGFASVQSGKKFYVLGTGHSHMMPEEFFARLKGTDFFTPIIMPEFMLHQFPHKSTVIERLAPYADIVLSLYPISEGDTMMLVSNSGRNGLLVELAIKTKQANANLITCVNHKQAKVITSRHSSGKNMADFADVVIDNCGVFGDALHEIAEELKVGSTSNMVTILIAQMMNAIMINLQKGKPESNKSVLERFETYFFEAFDQTLTQSDNVQKAAQLVFEAVQRESKFFVYGGGHSHLVTEELYSRAGGVPYISPILEDEIMVHMSYNKSNLMETSKEYAHILMKKYGFKANDLILIASNSGKGKLTVELARIAKDAGLKVIALTNVRQAKTAVSDHESGQLLAQIADVVIDNCAPVNDAAFMIQDRVCCPLSSSLALYLAQSLIVDLCYVMIANGIMPPIAISANVEDPKTDRQKELKEASRLARIKYASNYIYQGPKVKLG